MSEPSGWIEENIPAQYGKLFLVTDANTGLGYEVTRGLAEKGATVVMASRDLEKGEEAAASICEERPYAVLIAYMQNRLAGARPPYTCTSLQVRCKCMPLQKHSGLLDHRCVVVK